MKVPFGFTGASYKLQSQLADDQLCVNFYLELDESGSGTSKASLMPTPGIAPFVTVPGGGNSPAVDQTFGVLDNGTAGGPTSYGPFTPAVANEYVFSLVGTNAGVSISPSGTAVGSSGYLYYTQLTTNPETLSASYNPGVGAAIVAASVRTVSGAAPIISQNVTSVTGTNHFASPVGVGDSVLVSIIWAAHTGSPVASVVDDKGNAYPLIISRQGAGGSNPFFAGLWILQNISNTPQTITITISGGTILGGFQATAADITNLSPAGLTGVIRGEYTINGRAFVVSGSAFVEILAGGTTNIIGTVANDSLPVSMDSSPTQVIIGSAGFVYVYNLQANTFVNVNPANFPGAVSQVGFCESFGIALIANSSQWYASQAGDMTIWPPLSFTQIGSFPDNAVGMIVDHDEIWFGGQKHSIAYYNAGTFPFPFQIIPGSIVEVGWLAKFAQVRLDNTVFWISQDERGAAVAWRAAGYVPQRVSDQGVEFAWQSYIAAGMTLADAIAFSYQDQGHHFWVINFPTANKTWVYDVNTQKWHERGYFLQGVGQYERVHYQNHMYVFGKHLVGDWKSPTVYQLSIPQLSGQAWTFADDAGNPIRRARRASHIFDRHNWMYIGELEVFLETGLGPQPPLLDGGGNPRDPQMSMRMSKDGGRTWSNEMIANCGQVGQYGTRAVFRRLGRGRVVTFEIVCSDAIPWRILDGYIDAEAEEENYT